MKAEEQTAVVVGAGPSLGQALVDRFTQAGMRVAMVSRYMQSSSLGDSTSVLGYAYDATNEQAIKVLFKSVEAELGPPDLVVFWVPLFRGIHCRLPLLMASPNRFVAVMLSCLLIAVSCRYWHWSSRI